jgi:hypothetical protein
MPTESDLRAALLSLEDDAPSVDDVLGSLGVLQPARSHPGRNWLMAGAAAAVVALAVAVPIATRHHDGPAPGTPVVTTVVCRTDGAPTKAQAAAEVAALESRLAALHPSTKGVTVTAVGRDFALHAEGTNIDMSDVCNSAGLPVPLTVAR